MTHDVCQGLAVDRWFFQGTPVSSTNKTDRPDTTEISMNVALPLSLDILHGCQFNEIVLHSIHLSQFYTYNTYQIYPVIKSCAYVTKYYYMSITEDIFIYCRCG